MKEFNLPDTTIRNWLRQASGISDCLVVMGTQGRGIVPGVFLGSVSHAVARHAVAPVLLVPPGAAIR